MCTPRRVGLRLPRIGRRGREVQEEIEDLCWSMPKLANSFEFHDLLGTGTVSSVYKPVDINLNNCA